MSWERPSWPRARRRSPTTRGVRTPPGPVVWWSAPQPRWGAATTRIFPKASELAANIGGKASNLKLNMTTSLNTKIASLGDRLATFGPEPAMAGAGRTSSVFETTSGPRSGASSSGIVMRAEDGTPAAGRSAGAATDHLGTSQGDDNLSRGRTFDQDAGGFGERAADATAGLDGQPARGADPTLGGGVRCARGCGALHAGGCAKSAA